MSDCSDFIIEIKQALNAFLDRQQNQLPLQECLRIDLHCHDSNSDVPDELLGRMLRLPETWLPKEHLIRTLRKNEMDAFTVTNHNNARSCWQLMEKGEDILVGAEFTCVIPDYDVRIHVLAYGFSPDQEARLLRFSCNIYQFLEYAISEDIPTILAHPLHFYSPKGQPPPELFEMLGLLFERFEVVNGQRDTWQNLLTAAWVRNLNEEKLEGIGKRLGLRPGSFCRNPYQKSFCGGSDDHMGIFAGQTGTMVHIPNLEIRKLTTKTSALALEALRNGATAPFGSYNEEEKITLALLDYFCQVAINMKDPGLLRMLLHRGNAKNKLGAFLISNGMLELQRHRYTMRFLTAFHEALSGRRPGFLKSRMASRSMKPLIHLVNQIATLNRGSSNDAVEIAYATLPIMLRHLSTLLVERAGKNCQALGGNAIVHSPSLEDLMRKLEIPSHIRTLFGNEGRLQREDMISVNVGELFDGLSFPALASSVIIGASFAANHVLHQNRPVLDRFADSIGQFQHPKRALWLTDTFCDKNGVSSALQSILTEVQKRNLPIDFATCSKSKAGESHLHILDPIAEFSLPFYRSQTFRIPDPLNLQKLFRHGAYDRIVCSTELSMGILALFLKKAFCVPAYFYIHTDWLDFADKTLKLDSHSRDRLRRALRAFYRSFDGLFVLNSEQVDWLAGPTMGIPHHKIFKTAHWADRHFVPTAPSKKLDQHSNAPVLLFAGRISEEKGVLELPQIYADVRKSFPDAKLIVAGDGPADGKLRELMPEAHFLGWVDRFSLPALYSSADLLLLPSRFDTFGCVILEAMSCGLPAIAFNTKGPRDLIEDGLNGFLAESTEDFPNRIVYYLANREIMHGMRASALDNSRHYNAESILNQLMEDLGFGSQSKVEGPSMERPTRRSDISVSRVHPNNEENSPIVEEIIELLTVGSD
jgi:glycosyltransferase involved in cell wall biosynthesis